MKKIISVLILTALLLSSILAIVPVAAEEAEPAARKNVLATPRDDQMAGIGPAFYYDYHLYNYDIGEYPIDQVPRKDGSGTGYQGKRPYMLRSRNASSGSATSIDGLLDSYTSTGAYNSFQRGYELNFVTDNMGVDYEFDAWLGVSLKETKTIDAFSFYTLNKDTCGSKYLIEEITLFGARIDPATHTYGSWFKMMDTYTDVQGTYTEDGKHAFVTGDLYMPFEVDYIFMAFKMAGEGDGNYLCVELEAYEYEGGATETLDFAALNEAITAAETELAKEGAYTSKSFNTLKLATDAGKNALTTAATQKAVDHAVATIYEAILSLEALADISALTAELAKYENAVETDYTILTWEAFATARDAATGLIASSNYSETAVGEALMAFIKAAEALAIKASDDAIAALKAKYDEASALVEDKDLYTPDTYATLRSALRGAGSCVDDESRDHVSETQCEEAMNTLVAALEGLKTKADISALQAVVDDVLAISADKYTAESYAALAAAITAAQEFIAEKATTGSEEEAQALAAAITAAKNALAPCADFSAIDSKVIELEALVEADYTAESWKALKDAIAAALALDSSASQADADKALADIVAAEKALVKAPKATEPATDDGSTSEGGCGGIVGASAVVIVASLGLGAVVLRRKED